LFPSLNSQQPKRPAGVLLDAASLPLNEVISLASLFTPLKHRKTNSKQ
jgi:hypothetical protein